MDALNDSRRTFLRAAGLLAVSSLLGRQGWGDILRDGQLGLVDEEIIGQKFRTAAADLLNQKPICDVIVGIGMSFVGTPYVAGTLEQEGEEHLVINLHGLDCVTFVENTLALARCVKLKNNSPDGFASQLQIIRYRAGRINGYPSRLHYFTDWISDNETKGIVKDVTKELGGDRYKKRVDFMSTHRAAYRQLSSDASYREILRQEKLINARKRYFIPKSMVTSLQKGISDGDIIAITTSTEGLDISHTGLAFHSGGVLRYLHAPLTTGAVQVSDGSLVEYLNSHKKHTGIMVVRPVEPNS